MLFWKKQKISKNPYLGFVLVYTYPVDNLCHSVTPCRQTGLMRDLSALK